MQALVQNLYTNQLKKLAITKASTSGPYDTVPATFLYKNTKLYKH